MKRTILLILGFCLIITHITEAQQRQQYAIVKTRGRLQDDGSVIEGRRIPGALVAVKGGSKVFSNNNGELWFGVSSTEEYYISSISKDGYILSDADVISKQHKYQAEPINLLLESAEELNAYRRSIERKVRRNYQHQLDLLYGRIDSLESSEQVNKNEIAKLRAELERSYNLAEKYVDNMTERYLNIDFDKEDAFDRKISHYIINGELDKADSMLTMRGDITERALRNIKAQQVGEQDRERIAKDCYSKYEIANQRFKRDSAAYYLDLRAKLNPHNIDWQIDVASYLINIIADYNHALSILEPALIFSLEHYGEYHNYTKLQ